MKHEPAGGELRLRAPGSKSQTQRALLLGALGGGGTLIQAPLECDDSHHLKGALAALGAAIEAVDGGWQVAGFDGRPRRPAQPLDCGEGGTTLRFLAPVALLLGGGLTLLGRGRLARRPHDGLLAALDQLGALVQRSDGDGDGSLRLTLQPTGPAPRRAVVDTAISSQFASALLMIAPCLPDGLELELRGPQVSRPYLELTLEAMARFGASVQRLGDRTLRVPPGRYRCPVFPVESDWSAAAFLLAAGWITGRRVVLEDLPRDSTQGDRVMPEFLAELDRPSPHRFDLTHCPDLVAPLAAACCLASHPSEITGVAHARLKESDRLAVLAEGLRLAGAAVEQLPGGLRVTPGRRLQPARLDPAGDHRMAMAFGLLSLRQPGLEVLTPGCVAKSYPGFWQDLERFR